MTSRRPASPAERPLDDGPRAGTDPWRTIDGVAFCHWDRWLLRLALTEPEGLNSIAGEFRDRSRAPHAAEWTREEAAAMLRQVVDLQARLDQLGRTPATALSDEKRASEWLRKKAFRRVWHGDPQDYTAAMRDAPKLRLEQRALRGNWARFPVSPARYEPSLRAVGVTKRYAEYWETGYIARRFEDEVERLDAFAGFGVHENPALERLALYRAALTVLIETMARVDDSGAEVAGVYRRLERTYLELLRGESHREWLLRDLLELAVWEDYGMTRGVEDFLRALPEVHADRAVRELAAMLTELREHELDCQVGRARALRQAVMEAAAGFEDGDDADS